MSGTTVGAALDHVADVLSSPSYSDKEVLILIPHIRLANEAANKKYMQDCDAICAFSFMNEPGTQKFCTFQNRHDEEAADVIWALEHFDSESALEEHRASPQVVDMVSWLQNAKPNGTYPLPMPIPLQIIKGSFVRSAIKEFEDPFIVITQIGFPADKSQLLENSLVNFSRRASDKEDVLAFIPGKRETEAWVVMAYETRQAFQKRGLVQSELEGKQENMIEEWRDHFLSLGVGYLRRT